MYNRYNDRSKFITDSSKLKIEDGSYVYISSEDDYGIAVDLDDRVSEFENLKPFISFVAGHICELDNIAQKFNHLSHPNERQFPFDLALVYIDKSDIVRLHYWGTLVNTEFDVVYKYKDNEFIFKSFGMLNNIPDDWDKEL